MRTRFIPVHGQMSAGQKSAGIRPPTKERRTLARHDKWAPGKRASTWA